MAVESFVVQAIKVSENSVLELEHTNATAPKSEVTPSFRNFIHGKQNCSSKFLR